MSGVEAVRERRRGRREDGRAEGGEEEAGRRNCTRMRPVGRSGLKQQRRVVQGQRFASVHHPGPCHEQQTRRLRRLLIRYRTPPHTAATPCACVLPCCHAHCAVLVSCCRRYLPKFKWDTLTEEINYQRAVREQRLVAEISAAKRERDFYLSRCGCVCVCGGGGRAPRHWTRGWRGGGKVALALQVRNADVMARVAGLWRVMDLV